MKKLLPIVLIVVLLAFYIFFRKLGLHFFQTKPSSEQLQKVILLLPYTSQVQWVAYYSAIYNNYYKDEGLDVEMQYTTKGGPVVIQQLVANKIDFGVSTGESIVVGISKGADIQAVCPIEPASVFYIVSDKKYNILSPKDLIGKKVGIVSPGAGTHNSLLAMLALTNIDKNRVDIIPLGTALVPSFLEGKIDAASIHLSSKLLIEKNNNNLNFIKAADYTDIGASHIIISRKIAKTKPQIVKKFLTATKKGLEYAVRNPKKAVDIYLTFNPDEKANKTLALNTWKSFIDIYRYNQSILSEKETAAHWKKMQDTLISIGLIKQETDVNRMFNNDFIPL